MQQMVMHLTLGFPGCQDGERKAESEVKEEDYYCCERSYGSFLRSIALPSHVDADKIEANCEDGVLEVSLPKVPEVKPKKIAVSAKKTTSAINPASAKKKGKAGKQPNEFQLSRFPAFS